MSLLLKAFPPGRPRSPRASERPRTAIALALAAALVVVALPLGSPAQAREKPRHHHARHTTHHARADRATHHRAHHRSHAAAKRVRLARAHKKKKRRPPRIPGQPPRNYVVPAGSYFSYPNLGKRSRTAIRQRVLETVRSTWGGRRDAYGAPLRSNGTIRLMSWTFDDWKMAHALVAAKKRGVSVQIVVAKAANRGHASWSWLRRQLGHRLYRKGVPSTAGMWSYARYCRGSCRGRGGTAHAKFFLFNNVGAQHTRTVTMQTSMNLTTFAFTNQWNQADVSHLPAVYADFITVFAQIRAAREVLPSPYRVRVVSPTTIDYFFPRYHVTPEFDPAMQALAPVSCTGATTSATGRTAISVIQYAIYGDRGLWLARRLRALWESGCSVRIIYSIANRAVLGVLRSRQGRGPVPMKQSVVTDWRGTITKYNHSKWMTVTGHWGAQRGAFLTFSGSANWSDLALTDDEQMQRVLDRSVALRYLAAFARTWRQRSSHHPGFGTMPVLGGRIVPTFAPDVPLRAPAWGRGVFRYMTPD